MNNNNNENTIEAKDNNQNPNTNNKKGLLIVISGPSGVGKGTITKVLVDKLPAKLSISATTRPIREYETNGKDYYFISKEEFERKIAENAFFEYATYNDDYYGTPREKVLEELEQQNDIITEIEVNGAKQIKESYPESILIYILPPTMDELYNRLKKRGTETREQIEKRMDIAYKEIDQVDLYDYVIINDNLDKAINKIYNIIKHIKDKA